MKKIIKLTETDINNLVSKIIKEENNSNDEWAICTKSLGYKDKFGKLKIHPENEEKFKQCKEKVKKNLKENRIDEVGGYDSIELSNFHGDSTMDLIRNVIMSIVDSGEYLNKLKMDIIDDKFSSDTKQFINQLSLIVNKYSKSWVETEKKRQSHN